MLELICHHSYTWNGLPADQSPYRNDGQGTNTSGGPDGREPGSGYVIFPQSDSRIRIPLSPDCRHLTALKIEALVKVDPLVRRRSILVAGDGSFRFGIMEGAIEADFDNASHADNYIRSADAYAPDHAYHPVPPNRWVRLGFHHDGFAKMRLFIDDALVGEAIANGAIPPVQGGGLSIGNSAVGDGEQFPGQIDELKIWRLDHKMVKREFLGRPFTPKTAKCWESLFTAILAWQAKNPERFRAVAQQVAEQRHRLLRAVYLLPDGEQARLQAVMAAFAKLWFSGAIKGPEMAEVLCDWISLLRSQGIDPWNDRDQAALAQAVAGHGIADHKLLECDKDIAAFARLLADAVATCGIGGGGAAAS